MVFGVIIASIEDKAIHFNQFYGETANDTRKNHRIKFLLTKLQENCIQQIEISREKQKIFNFFQKNEIVNQKIKTSFMSVFYYDNIFNNLGKITQFLKKNLLIKVHF